MLEARRGHGMVGAAITTALSYLFVIGGDGGSLATAKRSVEGASVSKFGDLSTFQQQRNQLPAPVTFGTTKRIGQFIYLAAGYSGTALSNVVYRAHILSPRQTVAIDVAIDVTDVSTSWPLSGGFYYYRVAAVYGASDASNPSGESLPGDYLSIRFPKQVPNLAVVLAWDSIPGAVSYRLYRTNTANENAGNLQLVAEVPKSSGARVEFEDSGAAVLNADAPLPDGSLGKWHAIGTLPVSAIGMTSNAVRVGQDGNTYHYYVAGGQTSTASSDGGTTGVHMCTVALTPEAGLMHEEQDFGTCVNVGLPTPAGFNFGQLSSLNAVADGLTSLGTTSLLFAAGA